MTLAGRRELAPHIGVALDLIGQAIEKVADGCYATALDLYTRAAQHCLESKAENAPVCRRSCELAIEHLRLAIAGDPEDVSLECALHPDLGHAAANRRRQEQTAAAQLDAARREKVAEYNKRRHGADIAIIEKALAQLAETRPTSGAPKLGAHAVVERLRNDLVHGHQRGITPEQWKFFADTCRREGISF